MLSPRRRVMMLVTWNLAEDTGYTINTRRTIEELDRRGFEVLVVELLTWRKMRSAASLGVRWWPATSRVTIPPLGHTLGGDALGRRYVAHQLSGLTAHWHPRFIHARGLAAGSFASGLGCPVLLDVRGDIVTELETALEDQGDSSRKAVARIAHARRAAKSAFSTAGAVVSVSEAMRDWTYEVHPETLDLPSAVIPCAVPALQVTSDEPAMDTCSFTVVYAGGMQAYQPPEEVFGQLQRVAEATDADRIMVLTGDLRPQVLEARDRLCPTAVVRSVPSAEVQTVLMTADLGVIPRIPAQANRVACPTKIAEYLAVGLPIAVSENLGSWASDLTRLGVGIRLESDEGALRQFGMWVRESRSSARKRCREVAAARFSLEAMGDSYEMIYGALDPELAESL